MSEQVYDAFRSLGVSEEHARNAAVAIGAVLDQKEPRLQKLETDVQELKADMRLLKWMVGTNIAISITLLFRVFSI